MDQERNSPNGRKNLELNDEGEQTPVFQMRDESQDSIIDIEDASSRGETEQNEPEDRGMPVNGNDDLNLYGNTGVEGLLWGIMSIKECEDTFEQFVKLFSPDENYDSVPLYLALIQQIDENSLSNSIFVLNVDMSHIYQFNNQLYNNIITAPRQIIPIMDVVVDNIFQQYRPDSLYPIQVRLFNIKTPTSIRDLGPEHIGTLVSIGGMISRVSAIIPQMYTATYVCGACQFVKEVPIDENLQIVEPTVCPRCQARDRFVLKHNQSTYTDLQIVRIQENPENLPDGRPPLTLSLTVTESLVDSVRAGDRVTVTGVFSTSPSPGRTKSAIYKTYIDVVHFNKINKERLALESDKTVILSRAEQLEHDLEMQQLGEDVDIYEKLTHSLAPSIWELNDVKRGLLCQLFGGSHKESESYKFRSDINILLCGDPGTSKSQLLSFVHKIAPRGVYTSGKGSSAVGLTASVVRDQDTGESVLESGALVLSDGGICCIDEFDKMADLTRAVLHEVMEQQTVSIAKAGVICTLNARTAILASANPRESRYNPRLSVVDNLQLPPTLLSRFDLIYLILDKPNEKTDRMLARHLVSIYWGEKTVHSGVIPLETLMHYIEYAKTSCNPKLSTESARLLASGYVEMRQTGATGGRKTITATPRQLEAAIRMSEALAKMRLSRYVEIKDVQEAFRLMRVAIQQAAIDPRTGTIDMDVIATGKSAARRQEEGRLADQVIQILSKTPGNIIYLSRLKERIKQDKDTFITAQELNDAISMLASDGFVEVGTNKIRLVKSAQVV